LGGVDSVTLNNKQNNKESSGLKPELSSNGRTPLAPVRPVKKKMNFKLQTSPGFLL
jgi:hypothetical protein